MATLIEKLYSIRLGVQGENIAQPVEIDMTSWAEAFPGATFHILFRRYNETTPYPVVSDYEAPILTWTPTATDTAVIGVGYTEVRAIDPETGLVKKSRIIPTSVENSVTGNDSEYIPEPMENWVNKVLAARDAAIGAAAYAALVSQGGEASFEIDENGDLIYTFSDGTTEAVLNLGPITSYGLAKSEGFSGSEAEWVQKLINSATVSALNTVDGKVTTVNTRVTNLTTQVTTLSAEVDADVAALNTEVNKKINTTTAQAQFTPKPETDGSQGDALRNNGDGTTSWAPIGLPTDEQTATAVSDWLDDHPEATTTVEDGAITAAKLHEDIKGDVLSIPELKGAVGCDASEKSFSANGELMRVYPDQGAVYYIHGLSDSNVQYVDIYEYYLDETSTRLMRFAGNGEYNYYYTPASNASYARVYIVPVSGNTGSVTGQINDVTNAAKTLSGWVYKYAVMPYTSDSYLTTANNCMGFSGALALPDNKIFSVQATVTQDVFSDLPEYGYASTIATFVPRLGRTDKATRMYLFANTNGTACIGYGLSSRVTWTNISDKIDTTFQTMFGNPFTAFKTTSSNAEIAKFYPESGKEYDILLYGMAGYNTVKIYEFDTLGNYTEYASITGAETWNAQYTPSANTSYLRFYMTTSAQATASLAVLENPNVLSPLLNKRETSAADYMLSKEFAAVRKFTVIGDSMASGYYKESASGEQHGRNLEYSWPQIMARLYGMTAVNATQSGITTAGWWTDPNGYCKAMVTASNRSQVYVVGIGTNDYKDIPDSEITQEQIGSAADINASDYTQNADSFWGNYAKILQYIHDVAPDAKIICLTIPAPRPNTAWKQTAIRGICALSMFSDYVALCDLVADYNDLVNSEAMTAEMWQSHFTPVGYANSAELLMYALSKTIQNNLSMFINLPQIPYDS